MIPPIEAVSRSLARDVYQLRGNSNIIELVEEISRSYAKNGMNLYMAQDEVKEILCDEYGASWYDKSAEAVMCIVENVYADREREKNFLYFLPEASGSDVLTQRQRI